MSVGIIYLIKNGVNGKCYVGLTTKSLESRWHQHLREAKRNNPRPLYSAIRKHGEAAFEISSLEHVDDLSMLQDAERRWIRHYSSDDCNKGYNLTPGGNGFIGSPPEEMRKKISAALRGHVTSEDTKNRISDSLRGKSLSQDVRDKISSGLSRPECKKLRRQKMAGKTHTQCIKEKIGSSSRTTWSDPDFKTRMRLKRRGENNPRAMLTEDDVRRIRTEWISSGPVPREVDRETCVRYAEEIGCTPSAIFRMLRGHSWKHVVLDVDKLPIDPYLDSISGGGE